MVGAPTRTRLPPSKAMVAFEDSVTGSAQAVRGPETAAIAKTTATAHRQNDSLLLVFMVIPFCWHRIFCMGQPLRGAPCMSHQCFPWHALNKTRTVLTMKCRPRPRQRQLRAVSISETTRYREFGHRLENRASAKKGILPKTEGPPFNPLAQNRGLRGGPPVGSMINQTCSA